jgi:hypothetical protein
MIYDAFCTNYTTAGYNKNWLWKGGNLWYERWHQVLFLQPEFVQIISWNDFGESHYIGPLDDKQYRAFETGEAPFNYVKDSNLDHTGWLVHMPFLVDMYTQGTRTLYGTDESLVVSHHLTSTKSCTGGGTSANTADSLQLELAPKTVLDDRLYIAGLLTKPAGIYVPDVGNGVSVTVKDDQWDIVPDGWVGMYYTSIPLSGARTRSIQLTRRGATVQKLSTTLESQCFAGGMANWNARVSQVTWNVANVPGNEPGVNIPASTTWRPVPVKDSVCTTG